MSRLRAAALLGLLLLGLLVVVSVVASLAAPVAHGADRGFALDVAWRGDFG